MAVRLSNCNNQDIITSTDRDGHGELSGRRVQLTLSEKYCWRYQPTSDEVCFDQTSIIILWAIFDSWKVYL